MTTKIKTKVLMVNTIIAHYRVETFKMIDRSDSYSFEHLHDPNDLYYNVKKADDNSVSRHKYIRNYHFNRFTWQAGVINEAFTSDRDAHIFTGDVSNLSTWVAAAILRCRKKRVLFWTIGWHRPEKGLKKLARLSFYHLANHLLIYGDRGMKLGGSQGYPLDRMSVIYNSVTKLSDAKKDKILNEENPEKGFLVGAISRLTKPKRFDLLLEAVAKLDPNLGEVTVLLAGDGPEKKNLQTIAKDLNIRVKFLGGVYDADEIESIYRKLDVTVLPSMAGLATIQSLAHGVPVITHNNLDIQAPEMEAIVPGVCGDLYDYGDTGHMAAVIEKWIRTTKQHRHEVREACLREVEIRWSPEAQARRIIEGVSLAIER